MAMLPLARDLTFLPEGVLAESRNAGTFGHMSK
jgi:hypothetical protein